MTDSPLTQVLPNSLDELFSRDPEKYTSADIDIIVAALRAERARWGTGEVKKKTDKPSKVEAQENLSLGDLEL